MIAEFNSIPNGMTKKEYVSMTGWMNKGDKNDIDPIESFPLEELVKNKTIYIDTTFTV
tara:strand:+ start:366 stop:539 length:174 start_codon:yes stop_codon:yes gene_type:complete